MWSLLIVDLIADDAVLRPYLLGTGDTREEAHEAMAAVLAVQAPALLARWNAGARDDTVSAATNQGVRAWAITEHDGDSHTALEAWTQDFAAQIGVLSQLPDLAIAPVVEP